MRTGVLIGIGRTRELGKSAGSTLSYHTASRLPIMLVVGSETFVWGIEDLHTKNRAL